MGVPNIFLKLFFQHSIFFTTSTHRSNIGFLALPSKKAELVRGQGKYVKNLIFSKFGVFVCDISLFRHVFFPYVVFCTGYLFFLISEILDFWKSFIRRPLNTGQKRYFRQDRFNGSDLYLS